MHTKTPNALHGFQMSRCPKMSKTAILRTPSTGAVLQTNIKTNKLYKTMSNRLKTD